MPRGRMGGRHGMSTEKAKDFKGTMKKLMGYLAQYKIGLLHCSDICNRKYYI